MGLANTLKFVTRHPLNRGHLFAAFVRVLKWQVGSRLVPGPVICDWIQGARIVVRPGETALTGNIYCGLQEFYDMSYVLHALGAEDLFVDVGANVGPYTILACAVKGARGCCFEPVPATFERLMDNIRLNNLSDRVAAFNIGISDRESELDFTTGENCMNHVVTTREAAPESVRVKVLPLDDVLGGQAPSIMKIDVEGFESLVLKGAELTLSNPSLHSVIMELNGSGARYGFDEAGILETMGDHGFSTYGYEPFTRTLTSLDGKNNLSGNTLFIRDSKHIIEKVKAAPSIPVGHVSL